MRGLATRPDRGVHGKNGKHDKALRLGAEENGMRKTTNSNALNLAVHDRTTLWMRARQLNRMIDSDANRESEANSPLLVPQDGVVKLAARHAATGDRQGRLLRPSLTRSFDFFPRCDVFRFGFELCETAIKFCAVRVSRR